MLKDPAPVGLQEFTTHDHKNYKSSCQGKQVWTYKYNDMTYTEACNCMWGEDGKHPRKVTPTPSTHDEDNDYDNEYSQL